VAERADRDDGSPDTGINANADLFASLTAPAGPGKAAQPARVTGRAGALRAYGRTDVKQWPEEPVVLRPRSADGSARAMLTAGAEDKLLPG
jgi:hypothetical protein